MRGPACTAAADASAARLMDSCQNAGCIGAPAAAVSRDAMLKGRKSKLKAKLESSLAYFSFER